MKPEAKEIQTAILRAIRKAEIEGESLKTGTEMYEARRKLQEEVASYLGIAQRLVELEHDRLMQSGFIPKEALMLSYDGIDLLYSLSEYKPLST